MSSCKPMIRVATVDNVAIDHDGTRHVGEANKKYERPRAEATIGGISLPSER